MEDPTNQPTPAPTETEMALSFSLLSDIRMIPSKAKRLAAQYSFRQIREAVGHWYMNRKEVGGQFQDSPGIVIYWLDNWAASAVPEINSAFKRTELYRRHRTTEEIEQDRSQDAHWARLQDSTGATTPAAPVPSPEPVDDETRQYWAEAVAAALPNNMDHWLATEPVRRIPRDEGECWLVGLQSPQAIRKIEWLQTRAARALERSLSTMVGQRVQVVFQEGFDDDDTGCSPGP